MTSLEPLFERFRGRGELPALAEIFDRTAPRLSALGVHLLRDPVEAEDLVQATFVAVIEGAGSFQGGRRLEPWLAGILARQAARVWRQRGRALERRAEAEPALDPSLAAEERELAEALELAFERLAPREREVLRRYLDGERPFDIAASQGKSAGAMRMQVLRGLDRLRKLLPAGLHAFLPIAHLPRGIESVRAEVLAHAGGAATLAPAALLPITLGVIAMSTKLAAAALVVSVLVYVSIRTLSEEAETTEGRSALESLSPPRPAAGTAEIASRASVDEGLDRNAWGNAGRTQQATALGLEDQKTDVVDHLDPQLAEKARSFPDLSDIAVPIDPEIAVKPATPAELSRETDGLPIELFGSFDLEGNRQGLWVQWTDGRVAEARFYERGNSTGPVFKFHPDGAVSAFHPIVDDQGVQGSGFLWHSSGGKKGSMTYRNSLRHGPCVYWNEDGSLDLTKTGFYVGDSKQ